MCIFKADRDLFVPGSFYFFNKRQTGVQVNVILSVYRFLDHQVWINKANFIVPKWHRFSCYESSRLSADQGSILLLPCKAQVDHLEQSAAECVMTAVRGADPRTARDAGSVWGAHNRSCADSQDSRCQQWRIHSELNSWDLLFSALILFVDNLVVNLCSGGKA